MGSLQNVTRWKPDGGDGAGCWACGPHRCWEGNGRAPSNPMAHAAEKRHKDRDMGSDGEPPSLLASVLEQAVQLQSRWLLEALIKTVSRCRQGHPDTMDAVTSSCYQEASWQLQKWAVTCLPQQRKSLVQP